MHTQNAIGYNKYAKINRSQHKFIAHKASLAEKLTPKAE